jgi:hypothetical protein
MERGVVTASSSRESLSLEQIENKYWGDPPAGATRLIATAYELRRKPIGTLDVEDLRLLLGQQEGVEVLVPLALAKLENDPLAEGDHYPGDLLVAVLEIPPGYWKSSPGQLARLQRIIESLAVPGSLEQDPVRQAINRFVGAGG